MTHLTADQLYGLVFETINLDDASSTHLHQCASCQSDRESLSQLVADLAVMQASQPTPAALARYNSYFNQVTQRGSQLGARWKTIAATLTWDSRQQPALQGMRNMGATYGYRLLYACDGAEIELMIEPEQNHYRLQGEFLYIDDTNPEEPALIQLLDTNGVSVCEDETDQEGCFRCSHIAPGMYRLVVSPSIGATIAVEALEIG